MIQFDGSYYVWFGDFETCLLLSVDDATGKITHAKFIYNEGVISVFKFWLEYFKYIRWKNSGDYMILSHYFAVH